MTGSLIQNKKPREPPIELRFVADTASIILDNKEVGLLEDSYRMHTVALYKAL